MMFSTHRSRAVERTASRHSERKLRWFQIEVWVRAVGLQLAARTDRGQVDQLAD